MDKFNEQLEEKIEYHLDRISKHKIPVKSESGIKIHTLPKRLEKILEEKENDLKLKPKLDLDRCIAEHNIPLSFNIVILFSDYMIEIFLLCFLVALKSSLANQSLIGLSCRYIKTDRINTIKEC